MRYTSHSEYSPLHSICIAPAQEAFASQGKLNLEWATLNYLSPPDFDKAMAEYAGFRSLIEAHATEVLCFPRNDSVSIDAIYCRDASIATDHGMILCRMGKTTRVKEPELHAAFYKQNNIPILGSISSPGTLEGGDVAWLNETTLAVGHTYRTNTEGIRQLDQMLAPYGIQLVVVDLPHYKGPSDVFHLMSVLSPVDVDLAVVYSPLIPISFRNQLINMGFKLVEVTDKEFETMGCNVLAVAPRKCIVLEGNTATKAALKKAGCEVLSYKGREISVKGGGGPTCLARPIKRLQ